MANQPNPASGGLRRVSSDRTLAIGWLLLGLLIGLLIGWVVWPVEWTDADPDNLRADARAHFIAATADAYVASGGQDPNTALARMQTFADPQAAVAEAIAFFQQSGDPRRAIREVNLRSLASALGSPAPQAFPSPPPAQTDTSDISWTNWLLGILTGVLLVGGGGWIIRRLLDDRRNAGTAPGVTPPAGQSAGVPPMPSTGFSGQIPPSDSGWVPSAPPDQSVSADVGRSVQMETWDNPRDKPAFAEPAFVSAAPGSAKPRIFPSDAEDEDKPLRRIVPGRGSSVLSDLDADDEEPAVIGGFIDFSDAESDEEDDDRGIGWEPVAERPAIRKVIPAALDDDDPSADTDDDTEWLDDLEDETSDDETPDFDALDDDIEGDEWDFDDLENDEPETDKPDDKSEYPLSAPALWTGGARPALAPPPIPSHDEDDAEPGILPTVQNVLNSLGWGEKEGGAKGRDGKEIGSYTAEYNAGILAYEQSFTITASGGEDGTPLGACGMGISEILDKSAANSNRVHVLDVWLYDGVDVRSASQYLVSPGLDKEALGEQAKSAGTITGEPLDIAPGVTFRIPSKNLLLECRIDSADFLTPDAKPSPLRTVRVEMKVRAAK